MKDEAPEGWIVTGYLGSAIHTPEHEAFLKAYQAKYNDYPRLGSVVGYTLIKAAGDLLRKAGSTDTDKLIAAAEGLTFDSPFGKAQFRASDHQSTLGAFVGTTALQNNKGIMANPVYHDGAGYLPSDDEVKKLRPGRSDTVVVCSRPAADHEPARHLGGARFRVASRSGGNGMRRR